MKILSWKSKFDELEAYAIIEITPSVKNKKAYYQVEHISQMAGVYYWMNPSTKYITHELFFDKPQNIQYKKDLSKQISRGVIWKKIPTINKTSNFTSLFKSGMAKLMKQSALLKPKDAK